MHGLGRINNKYDTARYFAHEISNRNYVQGFISKNSLFAIHINMVFEKEQNTFIVTVLEITPANFLGFYGYYD